MEKVSNDFKNEHRSTNSYYNMYRTRGNGNNLAKIENQTAFRSDLSSYEMKTKIICPGSGSKWTAPNCSGIPLDYDKNKGLLYMDGSDGHSLVIGATGSKKSRLIVMPTVRLLAASGETMIVSDPKGEVYRRTADYLEKQGYQIRAIDLREPEKGDSWNILFSPYSLYKEGELDKACELINDITVNLMPVSAKDPFWDYSARDLLFGLILLLFKICKEKEQINDFVNMRSLLKLKNELFSSTNSMNISNSRLWMYAKKDELIRARLQGTVVCPTETMSCIISVFDQHMSIFSLQPKLVNMLSHSSFDLTKIGFSKTAVFLIMPDEKTSYHRVVAVFIKQMYELLIYNAYKNTSDFIFPTRINFLLDEFTSLPQMTDMPQMITASRSRNIRFVLVMQSKNQLKERYKEEAETIMSNCSNWIFLTSRETELLREISELSGVDANKEPLISVSRLQHMDKEIGECLVLSGRKQPYFSYLPDIGEYDGEQYGIRKMHLQKQPNISEKVYEQELFFTELIRSDDIINLNDSFRGMNVFDRMREEADNELNGSSEVCKEDTDLEDLIKKIDEKIALLEEKEDD